MANGQDARVSGLDRARADLEHGDARKARERLKSWIATYPHDHAARNLLAQAYRDDGQPTEAGRWGYLQGAAATDAERLAFESRCAFGWQSRITEARLRHLLRCDDLTSIADDQGRAILASLPSRRNPRQTDGPLDGLGRWLSRWRAKSRHD
jgi:hypothetical protein